MRLAADANVLLAAVIGGRARLILQSSKFEEVLTTQSTLDEVREYATILARKNRLQPDIVLLAVASLPVTIVDPEMYLDSVPEARKRIGRRDPDDVEILALAIQFGIPIWSNDKDFEDCGADWYTTEDLLRKL